MDIDEAIKKVLEGIPSGYYFDSHLVLDQLLQEYSDAYFCFMGKFCETDAPTLAGHQQIGQKIKGHGDLVERKDFQSRSKNIHGQVSECAMWRRK